MNDETPPLCPLCNNVEMELIHEIMDEQFMLAHHQCPVCGCMSEEWEV